MRTSPKPLWALLCLLIFPHSACHADACYEPVAADFHPLYDRDIADHKYQSWDGHDSYWYWVRTFYDGYSKRVLGVSVVRQIGWVAKSRDLLSHVTPPPARQQLTVALNTLGRDIAGEWAKNDHVCRIKTRDLKRWGSETSDAESHDTGNGLEILAAVHSIQAEVDTCLRDQP